MPLTPQEKADIKKEFDQITGLDDKLVKQIRMLSMIIDAHEEEIDALKMRVAHLERSTSLSH